MEISKDLHSILCPIKHLAGKVLSGYNYLSSLYQHEKKLTLGDYPVVLILQWKCTEKRWYLKMAAPRKLMLQIKPTLTRTWLMKRCA